MDAEYERELRMRCIEAAAHARAWAVSDSPTEGVVKTASVWFDWVSAEKKSVPRPDKAPL